MKNLRNVVLFLVCAFLWAGSAVAQVPPTMKLCDGTQPGCPLIGAAALGGQLTAAAANGIAPSRNTVAASSRVLKNGAGNLYALEVAAGASAGFVLIYDANSAPADGTVTPVYCKAIPANNSVELAWPVPAAFSAGITVVFSTTGCFTQTLSATAFFSGMVK